MKKNCTLLFILKRINNAKMNLILLCEIETSVFVGNEMFFIKNLEIIKYSAFVNRHMTRHHCQCIEMLIEFFKNQVRSHLFFTSLSPFFFVFFVGVRLEISFLLNIIVSVSLSTSKFRHF